MRTVIGLGVAYLLGSIPTALIAGKAFKGIDLRDHGSGNLGATNAYRVLGAKVAALVMIVDVAKGVLPPLLLPGWANVAASGLWAILFGAAAIVGHIRPVFLLGKPGGKGVATSTGVFFALAWQATLGAFGVWALVLFATGYVSLASLVSALTLTLTLLILQGATPLFITAAIVTAFVFWSHRANIGRLLRGEEYRFGRRDRSQAGITGADRPSGPTTAARRPSPPPPQGRADERARP
jgi:glycerol-3-phosphate acyltransferase PlsY